MASREIEFEVSTEEEGERLDRILVRRIPELGRKAAATLFRAGAVRVDGRRAPKAFQPAAAQRVAVTLPEPDAAQAVPGPLDVLLERPDLVVVNKPAGQPTAVVRPGESGALVNALLARYPEMVGVGFGPREPGIIHRLDTQTSGVVVAARNVTAFQRLRSALESGALTKRYLALVASGRIPDAGTVTAWLGPHRRNRKKVAVYPSEHPGTRFTRSEYRVLARGPCWTLLEVTAPSAYRHQIRAHLAAAGHPIAGDTLYGGVDAGLGGRHALHASFVGCAAEGVESFQVSAPLPADLESLLRADVAAHR